MSPSHAHVWPADEHSAKQLACNSYFLQALVHSLLGSLIIHLAFVFQKNHNQSIKRLTLPHHLGLLLTSITTVVCVDVIHSLITPDTANNRLERLKAPSPPLAYRPQNHQTARFRDSTAPYRRLST